MAVGLIAYANSFTVPFNFDDESQFVYNPNNQSLEQFSQLSTWLNVNKRPLSLFTISINYVSSQNDVISYHIVNFLIHILSALFLYFWLNLLMVRSSKKHYPVFLPLVIALFFLIHPVQTQSVTYIIQRMTSLAGMFQLLSVWLYTASRIDYLHNKKTTKATILFIASLLAALMALLSKQTALTLPLLILFIEFFFIRKKDQTRCTKYLLTISLAYFAILTGAAILYGIPAETTEISRINYLATQMKVIPKYFQMMVMPIGLSIDHGIKAVETTGEPGVILGSLFILSVIGLAVFFSKKIPFLSFGIFWIFISLAVESSIIPIRDVMFDHRMYLALAGFSIALWTLLFRILNKKTKLFYTITIVTLIALTGATIARNKVWQDKVGIWEDVTKKYLAHTRGWHSAGRALLSVNSSNVPKIIRYYEKAYTLSPHNEEIMNDLASNYMKLNQADKALEIFEKLENSQSDEYRAMSKRFQGAYYLSRKEYSKAETFFNETLQIYQADTTSLQGLANIYMYRKQWNKALKYTEKYLSYSPNNTQILFYAAYLNYNMQNYNETEKYLLKRIELDPEDANTLALYANVKTKTKKYDEAIELFEKAYSINKNDDYQQSINFLKRVKQQNK